MDEDYVNRKIENCEKLILAASSKAQKEIYQGYLDYWTEKLEVVGTEPLTLREPDPGPVIDFNEPKPIDFTIDEVSYANMFEIENAPKQAYYNRGGEKHKTKAFKEYLNQKTQ